MFVSCFAFGGEFGPFAFTARSRFHCSGKVHDVSARQSGRTSLGGVAVRGAGIRKSCAETEECVRQVHERVTAERRVHVAREEILMHTGDTSPEAGLILIKGRVNGEYCGRQGNG